MAFCFSNSLILKFVSNYFLSFIYEVTMTISCDELINFAHYYSMQKKIYLNFPLPNIIHIPFPLNTPQ